MEEARIKPVVRALPEIEERRGLGEILYRRGIGARGNFTAQETEPVLDGLCFEWANDSKAHRGCDPAAQLPEARESERFGSADGKLAEDESGQRSQMTMEAGGLAGVGEERFAKDAFGGGLKRGALETAGAVGDVVVEKGVGQRIPFAQALRLVETGDDEGEEVPTELAEVVREEGFQFTAVTHFAVLTRGFESAGMREATGWKRRVDQLPDEPRAGRG